MNVILQRAADALTRGELSLSSAGFHRERDMTPSALGVVHEVGFLGGQVRETHLAALDPVTSFDPSVSFKGFDLHAAGMPVGEKERKGVCDRKGSFKRSSHRRRRAQKPGEFLGRCKPHLFFFTDLYSI